MLQEWVEQSGISVVTLVKKAGYKHRGSYYSHILKPDLSFTILRRYADVLKINFTEEMAGLQTFAFEDELMEPYSDPKNLKQAGELINHWKQKYFNLLEKYSRLIESEKS